MGVRGPKPKERKQVSDDMLRVYKSIVSDYDSLRKKIDDAGGITNPRNTMDYKTLLLISERILKMELQLDIEAGEEKKQDEMFS